MMTVGYQYSKNGGYFIDNMFMPTTNRHSVNFIFNDAYQIFHNGWKSIGDEDADKGILVNGGNLIAIGPMGMIETPSNNNPFTICMT